MAPTRRGSSYSFSFLYNILALLTFIAYRSSIQSLLVLIHLSNACFSNDSGAQYLDLYKFMSVHLEVGQIFLSAA